MYILSGMVRGDRADRIYTKRDYYESVRGDIRRNRPVHLRKQTLAQLKYRVRYENIRMPERVSGVRVVD